MTITRADVADLKPGDVVELTHDKWPAGTVLRGPVWLDGDDLRLGAWIIRDAHDGQSWEAHQRTLTVISRAPRPLYVNSDKTEPDPGDVVRDADSNDRETWTKNVSGFSHEWLSSTRHCYVSRDVLPARLRLLVDGRTGRTVQE